MSNGANQHYFLIYFFPKSKLCVQRNKQILQNKCCSKCLESDFNKEITWITTNDPIYHILIPRSKQRSHVTKKKKNAQKNRF